jgi:CheY-like chemotaxis protein
MSDPEKKHHTVLHFSCDPVALAEREGLLKHAGYQVHNATDGFDAIQVSTSGQVDAVLLDLNRNPAEIALIAQEIRRLRPELPTVVLTERSESQDAPKSASLLVPRQRSSKSLMKSLQKILAEQRAPNEPHR